MEIGSGIGNISAFFIENQCPIVLSDVRQNYCEYLEQHFSVAPNCKGIIQLDLVHPEFDTLYAFLFSSFDTVFALNVIEHIYNDALAISNAIKLLRKGGNLVILVPAYQLLYNNFDRELEHHRRYTRRSLTALMASSSLKIIYSRYFNICGIPGWFVSGRLFRNKSIPEKQLNFFNKIIPFCKIADTLMAGKAGLSVLSVGQKLS